MKVSVAVVLSVSRSSHRSQVLVSEPVLSAGGKKGTTDFGSGTSYEEGFPVHDQYVSISFDFFAFVFHPPPEA